MPVYVLVRQNHYDHLGRKFFPCDEIILAITAEDEKDAAKKLGIELGEMFIRILWQHFDDGDMERHHTMAGQRVMMPTEVPDWYEPKLDQKNRAYEWQQFLKPKYMPNEINWSLLRVSEIVQ